MTVKLEVGDKVKVVKVVEKEDGWSNGWNERRMTAYVGNGKVYTIDSLTSSGVYFVEDGEYGWPNGSLELVLDHYIDGVAVSAKEFARRTSAPVALTLEEISEKLGYVVTLK